LTKETGGPLKKKAKKAAYQQRNELKNTGRKRGGEPGKGSGNGKKK